MNEMTMQRLEYDKIKQRIREYAMSYLGKEHATHMHPLTEWKAVRTALDEADEALKILAAGGSVPIPSLNGIDSVLNLLGTGYLFGEEDFTNVYTFLHSTSQLKKYMAAKREIAPKVSMFAASLHELSTLKSEIDRCIRNGRITDYASKDLNKVRKKMAVIEERLKNKIQSYMNRHRHLMQEPIISMRGDRYVLPIKKEHRRLVAGHILDESASGQTIYIEPSEIAHLQQELLIHRAEEGREEAKVLGYLTGLTDEAAEELKMNVEIIGVYDFLFAKAKYAISINGRNVEVNNRGIVDMRGARHPLLGANMVPLDFAIGIGYRTLIITGPNTGGKTVALKTVGLLTMMVQSGIPVPVDSGSTFAIFTRIAADIGDGQSIEQSLSTFSAHIQNMIGTLKTADDSTLVLIDEMASGTDPGEGIGLSIAILEELVQRGSTVVATTHYNEIKHFAAVTPGFENARMEFDADTLRPMYVLRIGEAGLSYAFQIARNMGMPERIIRRSEEWTKRKREGVHNQDAAREGIAVRKEKVTQEDEAGWNREEAASPVEPVNVVKPTGLEDESKDGSKKVPNAGVYVPLEQTTTSAGNTHTQDPPTAAKKKFEVGDSVYVAYLRRNGIVYREEDTRGNVGVIIQQQKLTINKKRLTLHIPKAELYPDDYDFDIVFESKENRKKRKLMNRKHVEGLIIEKKSDE